MNKSLMNLWKGLIMLEQTKVTFKIQFMLHSQQLEVSVLKVMSQCCSRVGRLIL